MKADQKPCVRCKKRPQRLKHRYCKECHAEYMREYRRQEKLKQKKLEMTHCPHCGKALLGEAPESDHVVAKEMDNG